MRVTTKMLTQSMVTNLNNNLSKLQEYENQLSSGVRVTKPSDDPIAAGQILNAKSEMKSQEQYSSNMDYASGWLSTVDDALASADAILQRAREIAVSGSTGTTTQDSMEAMGDEVNSLVAEMVQIANTNYADNYIFGGGKTGSAPFTMEEDSNGNVTGVQFISSSYDTSLLDATYSQKIEIASGVTIDISSGKKVFHMSSSGDTELNGMFNSLIDLRTHLDSGDQNAVNADLDAIDTQIDNVINERAVVGAKSDRIESAQNRAEAYSTNLSNLISDLGDADYAEASTEYSCGQATYQAALSVGANIIQPSLLDFLK